MGLDVTGVGAVADLTSTVVLDLDGRRTFAKIKGAP